ncbi:hypothetical protein [Actinacidiphila sp. bgisy160]|uniref:hypothetical protein n=1 Tax=Actinacidiphila sp. bgisy160 TaxID=3413796 RepID=UPI003D703185
MTRAAQHGEGGLELSDRRGVIAQQDEQVTEVPVGVGGARRVAQLLEQAQGRTVAGRRARRVPLLAGHPAQSAQPVRLAQPVAGAAVHGHGVLGRGEPRGAPCSTG